MQMSEVIKQPMQKGVITFYVMKCFTIASILFVFGCGREIDFAFITYVNGQVTVNQELINEPILLQTPATLNTEKNSLAIVQIGTAAKCALLSDTSIHLTTNHVDKTMNLSLEKGDVVFELRSSGLRMNVEMDDAVFHIKKGKYEIIRDGDAIAVYALEGSAEMIKGSTSRVISEGEACELLADTILCRKLTTNERRMAHLLKGIKMVEAKKVGEIDSTRVVSMPVVVELLSRGATNFRESLAMIMLARKEGPLSVITTKEGKQLVGSVRARGKMLEITTRDGVVMMPQINIVSVVPYSMRQ